MNTNEIISRGYVTYEDFGALGDGKTNDFEAIMNAHEFANENKLPVRGNSDKTYYISDTELDGVARRIIIKTDVDWCGAHFIIDDTERTNQTETIDALAIRFDKKGFVLC